MEQETLARQEVRLQKVIAQAGVASRRKAEELGELRLETVETRSWEELLEILVGFHVARRSETGQPGLLGAGDLRALHRLIERYIGWHSLAAGEALRLALLRDGFTAQRLPHHLGPVEGGFVGLDREHVGA